MSRNNAPVTAVLCLGSGANPVGGQDRLAVMRSLGLVGLGLRLVHGAVRMLGR